MGGMREMGELGGFGGLGALSDFGMGFNGLILLVLLGVIFLALFVAFKKLTDRQAESQTGRSDRALEILKERYANGELDGETFKRMRRELE